MYIDSHVKGKIADAVMAHSFGKRIEALTQEHRELAADIWNDQLGKHKRALAKMPEGLVRVNSCGSVKFGGHHATLYWVPKLTGSWGSDWNAKDHVRAWPDRSPRYDAQHPFAVRYAQWHQKSEKLREDMTNLRGQVSAALAKARTVEKLLKEWPEIKAFIPKDLRKAAPLPALPAQELNAMIERARSAA